MSNNNRFSYRTVFQLSRSVCQIIAYDKGVPLVNALVLGNLFEYRINHYITKKLDFSYIFVAGSMVYLQPV